MSLGKSFSSGENVVLVPSSFLPSLYTLMVFSRDKPANKALKMQVTKGLKIIKNDLASTIVSSKGSGKPKFHML